MWISVRLWGQLCRNVGLILTANTACSGHHPSIHLWPPRWASSTHGHIHLHQIRKTRHMLACPTALIPLFPFTQHCSNELPLHTKLSCHSSLTFLKNYLPLSLKVVCSFSLFFPFVFYIPNSYKLEIPTLPDLVESYCQPFSVPQFEDFNLTNYPGN